MNRRILAIVLDLDGTLVDSAPDLATVINLTLVPLGRRRLSTEEVRGMIGDGVEALTRRALAATGTVPGEDAFSEILAAVRRHYAAAPLSDVYAEVKETVARLHAEDYALGICTNKPEVAAKKLIAGLGLTPYIPALAGGDTCPVKKPDPGHVIWLLKALRIGPDAAVMVGDGEIDAAAARAAGLPFIAVSYGYARGPVTELGADAVMDRFEDLPDVVRALEHGGRLPAGPARGAPT